MRLRPHDHLFAAAGVAAALSLMGAGAAALQGSVLGFHEWPLVAGEQRSGLNLPDVPAAVPEHQQPASVAQRALRQVLLTAGTGRSAITSISFTLPSGQARAVSS